MTASLSQVRVSDEHARGPTLWRPEKVLADILINVFVARGHVFGSFLKAHFRVVYPMNIKKKSGPENGHFLGEL